MGWNKLDRCVRDIFEQAGISGKTNHSLRVTGATRLYRGGIAEKTIQARTGHKSIEALRVYERPGEIQHKEASNVLANVPGPSGTLKDATNAMPVRINAPRSVVPALTQCTPSFNFSGCSVTIYNGPVMTTSSLEHNQTNSYGLSNEDIENFNDF